MANKYDNLEKEQTVKFYKYFNINRICRSVSPSIQADKLYNNFNGRYSSMDDDKERIFKLMKPIVQLFFEKLGYIVAFSKLKKTDE